ncbi:MAG TPA: hypothetical protein VI320_30545 [Terracidiphilus sp.]|jgi:hypothetical protein
MARESVCNPPVYPGSGEHIHRGEAINRPKPNIAVIRGNLSAGGSEKWGHFGRNLHHVAVFPLAATTSGISPRSGADDSLLDFSFAINQ